MQFQPESSLHFLIEAIPSGNQGLVFGRVERYEACVVIASQAVISSVKQSREATIESALVHALNDFTFRLLVAAFTKQFAFENDPMWRQ